MKYFSVFDDLALLLCPGARGLHIWGFSCWSCSTFCWSCVGLDWGRSSWSTSLPARSLWNWKLMLHSSIPPTFSSLIEGTSPPSLISINWWGRNSWSQTIIYGFLDILLRFIDFISHTWLNLHLINRCQDMPWDLCTFLIFRHFPKYLINLEWFRLHQSNFSFLVSLFHILKH